MTLIRHLFYLMSLLLYKFNMSERTLPMKNRRRQVPMCAMLVKLKMKTLCWWRVVLLRRQDCGMKEVFVKVMWWRNSILTWWGPPGKKKVEMSNYFGQLIHFIRFHCEWPWFQLCKTIARVMTWRSTVFNLITWALL